MCLILKTLFVVSVCVCMALIIFFLFQLPKQLAFANQSLESLSGISWTVPMVFQMRSVERI